MTEENSKMSDEAKYNFAQIENLVEGSLMHDWAISIEYAVRTRPDNCEWVKWDSTLFAIKDPALVMEKLKACCENNPNCEMKLVCEHFRPEFRLVYCLHKNADGTPQ